MGKGSRILALAMASVLAVGLWPGAAVAEAQPGVVTASVANGLQAQSTTRTVNGVTLEQNSGVWTVTSYSGSATSLNLNSLGVGVITKIGDRAFEGCTRLKSVTLPSTLQEIGDNAFLGCTGLGSITLPESLTSISWRAFKNCTGLTSVAVKSRALSVSYTAFANAGTGAPGITATFASTCGSVPSNMFNAYEGAPKVTKAVVSPGVKEVGYSAFSGCSYLTSVSLPTSVTSIGSYAFKDCSSLKSLKIPQNVSADKLGWNAYVNLGLNSKITATTGAQYKKLKGNSDYITTTRTAVVLASNSLYRAKVSSISNKPWSGKKITPSPVVKMGNKTLKKGVDYTLSYKNNKNLGVATVTIKGKGSYVGTKSVTFKIVPAKVTGVAAKSSYSGSLTVTWSTKLAKSAGASGYRLYYKVAGRKNANYYENSWNGYAGATIYSLPKRTKVTVKVQAYTYINGKKVYGPWSANKVAWVRA